MMVWSIFKSLIRESNFAVIAGGPQRPLDIMTVEASAENTASNRFGNSANALSKLNFLMPNIGFFSVEVMIGR